MIGDGHAMGVAAEILQHILGTTEGTFQVHDPVMSEQWSQPGSKDFRPSEDLQVSVKVEVADMSPGLPVN